MNSTGEETTRKEKKSKYNKQLEAVFSMTAMYFSSQTCSVGFHLLKVWTPASLLEQVKSEEPISHLFSSHTQPKKHHKYAKSHRPLQGAAG